MGNIPKLIDIPRSGRTKHNISIKYPELYTELMKLPDELSFKERLYWYYNKLTERPKCLICGNPTKFLNSTKGYFKYCSSKCSNNSDEVKHKKKAACQEKFGVDNPLQNKDIKQKRNNTIKEKYGVDYISQSELIKEKKRQTNLSKSGVLCNFLLNSPYIIDFNPNKKGEYKYKCPHPDNCDKCSEKWFEIAPIQHSVRVEFGTETCTRLLPYNQKSDNNSIELFIKMIFDENNIQYEQHNRTILGKQELDFYIPSKKIAIECNGVYWHSDRVRGDKTYHYNKWNECKEQGIQLISIWEDWIKEKPSIVKSLLLSKLGVYDVKVGARECKLQLVTNAESKRFLDDNHIQGAITSSVRLGLYYNNTLISIMTFGKQRKCTNGDLNNWELHRFCNKVGYCVNGAASKLFKYFIEHYNTKKIISFSSHDISDGKLYDILGFEKLREIKSSYWYIDSNTLKRYHRYTFNKKNLVKNGADPNLTEFQIMANTKYLRIYDSGQTTYEWKCTQNERGLKI